LLDGVTVTVPPRVTVPPFGPVTVRVPVTPVSVRATLPLVVTDLPFGPVVDPLRLQA